ncbi:MAG: glycosyltransferase [Anaerolineae bacterium]|nr:glycosyltransferase [Anaerolineae bacterium]
MKVLHIHSSDYFGGGGGTIAMERLHLGLRTAGITSKILCGKKTTQSPYSTQIPKAGKLKRLETFSKKFTLQLGLNDIHYLNSFKVKHTKVYKEADILHFHGTHGYFNYLAIPGLTVLKPAVFTLHDIWPFTGHCAMSYDCDRWKIGCGHCPYPDAHPIIKRDNTQLEWIMKDWVYSRSNLTIVALCSEIKKQAQQSMLKRFPIYQIPNGVDVHVYEPLDKNQCRLLLGLPSDKYVIMFAALELNQFNKGGDLLLKALQKLPETLKQEVILLTIGNGGEAMAQAIDIPIYDLGYIRNDRLKAISYAAADLFVSPTRAEAFGLVLLESMACGTPVVSFGVGGVLDLVRPGSTGYLAEVENADDLSYGIVELLKNDSLRCKMGDYCRQITVEEYNQEFIVTQHIDLYQSVVRNFVSHSEPSIYPIGGPQKTYSDL